MGSEAVGCVGEEGRGLGAEVTDADDAEVEGGWAEGVWEEDGVD